jgi:hypothetical protein
MAAFPRLLIPALLALSTSLAGCTTFYSSSVLGHESVDIPFRAAAGPRIEGHLGLAAKVAPTGSVFTNDKSNSIQGSLVATGTVVLAQGVRGALGVALSGYGAVTSIDVGTDSRFQTVYQDWKAEGWVLESRPGLLVDAGGGTGFLGAEVLYDREFGDYPAWRKTLTGTKVNLSPGDRTLTASLATEYAHPLGNNQRIALTAGYGLGWPNGPGDDRTVGIGRAGVRWEFGGLWVTASAESMDWLNAGLGLGLGGWLW